MAATYSASLSIYQAHVDAALEKAAKEEIHKRIWEQDHSVWNPEPDEISNRLGWLYAPQEMRAKLPEIEALVRSVQEAGYTDALLLGMGGSSLAPEVFRKTFGVVDGYLDLAVLDSTDPGAVLAFSRTLDAAKTLFIVATKSGGTVETLSFFKYFYNWAAEALGEKKAREHFIAITDPGSRLVELAKRYQFRAVFENDPNIGGRFSALSYFGLLPAALMGLDASRLLDRAEQAGTMYGPDGSVRDNSAAQLGLTLAELSKAGRDKLTLVASPGVSSFGDWVEQLIAESTGKDGKGILPVVSEVLAQASAYGDDRLFVQLTLQGDTSLDTAVEALEAAGHPVVRIELEDRYDIGGQLLLWELATAIAGYGMGIQPFNQPNVESAKVLARQMVSAYVEKGQLPDGETTAVDAGKAIEFFEQGRPGDYIALQAYVQPSEETSLALQDLSTKLRERYGLATTAGYGPRFLHSTGQLHKGDRGNGLFLQFVSTTKQDVNIPSEAGAPEADLSFGVLKQAQALGDAQALREAGRRVLSFTLEENSAAEILQLSRALL